MEINIEEYYKKYGPMVYRRCLSLLKNEDEAGDAMQDVFVKLLRYKKSLEHKYPSSLLFTIATNICLNKIKLGKREADQEVEDLLYSIASYNEGEKKVIAEEYLDKIFKDDSLNIREIAVMFYIDRMKLKEISDLLGISVSGVRKRLDKIKKIAAPFRENYYES
jgi:RNA polymerase sigma-70 factor (ECF subfamily)